jgi:hypothetical protein
LAKVKKFVKEINQCSSDSNILWRYQKGKNAVNTIVYAGGWWDWRDNTTYWGEKPASVGTLGR